MGFTSMHSDKLLLPISVVGKVTGEVRNDSLSLLRQTESMNQRITHTRQYERHFKQ